MQISIPTKSSLKKKYPLVVEELRRRIFAGDYDKQLPGVQVLGKELDVNFRTVDKALNKLAEEGIVYRIPKQGTFINKGYKIGLMLTGVDDESLQVPIYGKFLQDLEQASADMGCTLQTTRLSGSLSDDERMLLSGLDGCILFGSNELKTDFVKSCSLPCVEAMGIVSDKRQVDHATYDDYKVGELAAEYLFKKGHQHCACLSDDSIKNRNRAFEEAFTKAGGKISLLTYEGDFLKDASALQGLLKNLVELNPRPTGLFLPSDLLTLKTYAMASRFGLTIGDDLDIVSCNNSRVLISGLYPEPASVSLETYDVAKSAIELLLKRIKNPKPAKQVILTTPKLITYED